MQDVINSITGDLRIALLLLGVLLLLVIVVWELVQRRRASRADAEHLKGPLGQSREVSADDLARTDPLLDADTRDGGRREPTLTLPEMSVRDRLVEPPLVDLDAAMDDTAHGRSIPVVDSAADHGTDRDANSALRPVESGSADHHGTTVAAEHQHPTAEDKAPAPKLELPTEAERVIVALRVVARGGERFSGASLRQSLLGEGFVHGEMDIFHRATADGRILLSAASLTKPGSFDLATMDSSRFLGINLFAVLPGPLPGRDAVDKLLLVAHTLAQRLKGDLLDSQGQPLTEARLAEMRLEAARGAS
ncbi:MAG: hypothetical protein KJS95_09815 [Gammaproteobacteria bacterium]|nr:hypothetical protein [Gammaproteobacteria bacterium]